MEDNIQRSLEDQIFKNHYNYYKEVGVETIKIASGHMEQVSADYQGRVIYELLQNAFDRAEKNILVQVKDNSLYVANDGEKFTYNANHDYKDGTSQQGIFKRCDFQSMCSISTSTKNASTSIGNKGVGFKSVFSIAEFANIYTKGKIIDNDKIIDETISFRLYDSFKDPNKISTGFNEAIRSIISENIRAIQKEDNLKNRGVPGYYYPLHIENEDELYVNELFSSNKSYVTIIEIPFSKKERVKELFQEIKKIHFQFVQLKYPNKDFEITFDFDGEIEMQSVEKNKKGFFSAEITNNKIRDLAEIAGIPIGVPKVAIYIRKTSDGKLYNYLPTKVDSPFRFVDFHADFHTKIDRTEVNFDVRTPIGEYNSALLRACTELYFVILNNFLGDDNNVDINVDFIDQKGLEGVLEEFEWNILKFGNTTQIFHYVRNILRIWNYSYQFASSLIGRLALLYFKQKRSSSQHQFFIKTVIDFINCFGRGESQEYRWLDYFKGELAKELRVLGVGVIPNVSLSESTELLYRKTADSTIQLPDFLGINITDFDVEDKYFREALGIKDFSDYNELLKYYKQCSFSGEYNQESIEEEQQIELIKSLFQIFEAKKEQSFLVTHRFTRAYNSKLRENNSSLNQANFNISTVFLKTKQNKYKPAQLCALSELDSDFIKLIVRDENRNDFLRFLGVSTNSNHLFADCRMYNKLKDGIDFIPSLTQRGDDKIDEELIRNFNIITLKGVLIHPATVNDNNYRFLENILNQQIKDELENILVKKYYEFPGSYREILKERITQNLSYKNDVIRLYQSTFHLFEKFRQKQYLILENEQLFWTESLNFKILNSKYDFDLVKNLPSTKVLCYYGGADNIPEYLKNKLTFLKKGKIIFDKIIPIIPTKVNLKEKIKQSIVYLLISISHSKSSEKNYLDDNVDLGEIQKKLELLEILEVNQLQQEIIFNEIPISTPRDVAIDDSEPGKIYFKSDACDIDKAQCIAEYLFNNSSIKELVELIVFYKEIDDLKKSVDHVDFEIINKKWKVDFAQKFIQFENEILSHFGNNLIDEKWFVYNEKHKSAILIDLENSGKLNELYQVVNSLKLKDEYLGYFENFEIVINRNEIENIAAKLISFLKTKEDVDELKQQILELSTQLGTEVKLTEVEKEIELKYPEYNGYNSTDQSSIAKKIRFESKINDIFSKFGNHANKKISSIISDESTASSEAIPINSKKIIFQQNGFGEQNGENLEIIGANGEEEVLIYYIHEFIKLSIEERIIGINAVYDEIKSKTGNDSLVKFKDKCAEVIDKDEDLKKALIPLFYITMHYKYSYFDIIAFKNGKPVIVEVKTTNGINNNRFFLSISEVNAARANENYEIVRVSPESIRFLGNPIRSLEGKIELLKADTFSLTPRNYEFNFINN